MTRNTSSYDLTDTGVSKVKDKVYERRNGTIRVIKYQRCRKQRVHINETDAYDEVEVQEVVSISVHDQFVRLGYDLYCDDPDMPYILKCRNASIPSPENREQRVKRFLQSVRSDVVQVYDDEYHEYL